MKKLLYISFLFISVLLVSCVKQDITPTTDETRDVPGWHACDKSNGSDDPIVDTIDDDDGGEPSDDDGNDIVDPRFDPDGKGK